MFTMVAENTRKTFSALAAVTVVSFGALVMDQAYLASAPQGTIEIGELTVPLSRRFPEALASLKSA